MAGHESYACNRRPGTVELPVYSIYLIGFTYFFMFLAIIGLSAALYLAKKKKTVPEIDDSNKQYECFEEPNKNNGSTLTVNSGVVQIVEPRRSDPITPTRVEDSKIIFAKKPAKPIGPMVDKVQMDAIIKEVLNKVTKSDSACYRDLNELLKFENKEDNSSTKGEDAKENKDEERTELKPVALFQLKTPELKKVKKETENKTKIDIKDETKQEFKKEITKETEIQTKLDQNKDVQIEINDVESLKNENDSDSATEYDTVPSPIRYRHSGPDPEQDMYDTVPNPMLFRHSGPDREQPMYDTVPNRFRHSDPEPDQGMYDTVTSPQRVKDSVADPENDLDDVPYPLYDLPPMRNHDSPSQNVIQMDSESQYLFPISAINTESCYINAKTPKS